jgi:acetyl-CoA carboxylase biotin carboxyl carrier protein
MAQKKQNGNPPKDADALFSIEAIKDFIKFFEKVDVAEVEIKVKDKSLSMSKKPHAPQAGFSMPVMEQRPAAEPPKAAAAEKKPAEKAERPKNVVEITAPIVGTFYRSPEPGAAPFVKVGDVVEPGKAVCLIEAMKIFNEIKAEVRGTVKEVCVDNEMPVEFGQALFLLEIK